MARGQRYRVESGGVVAVATFADGEVCVSARGRTGGRAGVVCAAEGTPAALQARGQARGRNGVVAEIGEFNNSGSGRGGRGGKQGRIRIRIGFRGGVNGNIGRGTVRVAVFGGLAGGDLPFL